MATIQSGKGRIVLFEDFLGPEWIIAETAASGSIGPFRIIGDGIADTDAGVLADEATAPLSGAVIMGSANTDKDSTALATSLCFDVAKMAPIILETRVQFADLDTKSVYFGLTSANGDDLSIEDDVVDTTSGTAVENTATHLCGFYLSDELTDDEDWHAIYKGGTTAATTVSGDLDLDDDAVVGEWQILRLEVDPNGTARWYIDGVLLKTLAGAVSTTADLAVVLGIGCHGATFEYMQVDYLYVSANRDWTV